MALATKLVLPSDFVTVLNFARRGGSHGNP